MIHFAFLAAAVVWIYAPRTALLLALARLVLRRDRRQRRLRHAAAARRAARRQPRRVGAVADHRRGEPDQHLRRRERRDDLPPERDDGRPEPSRDHADRPAARPRAALPAPRARPSVAEAPDGGDRLPRDRRARDAVAQRPARPSRRRRDPRASRTGATSSRGSCSIPIGGALAILLAVVVTRLHYFEVLLRTARLDERRLGERALRGLQLRAADPPHAPVVRAGPEHVLRLLRVRDRQEQLGPALVLRRRDRRDRARRRGAVRPLHRLGVRAPQARPSARPRAHRRARPACSARAPARLGLHRRARRHDRRERLLPDDAVLLLLRAAGAGADGARRVRAPRE